MSPVESRCIYAFYFAYSWQSCANMTPSIKQEVHNVSQRHLQSTTEQRPQATCKNLVKIGREVLEICSRAPGIARRGGPGRLSLLGGTVHGAGAERRHGRRSTVELVHHTDRTNSVHSTMQAGGRPSTEADGVDHASVVNFVPRGWTLSARMLTRPEVSRPRRRRRPVSHGEGQRHARPRPRLRTRKYSFG